jgi:hypothetical protein
VLLSVGAAAAGVAAANLTSAPAPALAANLPFTLDQDNPTTALTSLSGSVLTDASLVVSNYYSLASIDHYSDALQAYTFGAGFAAVYGRNDAAGGSAITGYSGGGLAATLNGGFAPLLLAPAATAGAPTTTGHQPGEIYVDKNGAFYVYGGTSPTWKRLTTSNPITPVRVLDTRTTIGGHNSPFHNSDTFTLNLAGVPVGATSSIVIPADAVGVLGNITAVQGSGGCFLAVFPGGTAWPGTSSINFPPSVDIANFFTAALGGSPGAIQILAGPCGTYTVDVVVDIFGYIQ